MMQGQIYRGVGDTVNILWKSKYQLLSAFKTVQLVYNRTVFLKQNSRCEYKLLALIITSEAWSYTRI